MRFDIIIGNPPYQKESGGIRPKEIYSDFIINSINMRPNICCLITPTRWYNGSAGNMVIIREELLNNHTSVIVDYQKSEDVFENTQISGGISYWLWNKNKKTEECMVKHIVHDKVSVFKEKLDSEIFLRYKEGLSILEKISRLNEFKLNETFGFWKTFSNIHINDEFETSGDVKFTSRDGKTSYLDVSNIVYDMIELLDKYKVVTGAMTPGSGVQKSDTYTVINYPRIIEPFEVFSDYYYTLGIFDTLEEASNFKGYIETKFARALIQLINTTTSFNQSKLRYVPVQNWNESWTDEKLYDKYNLDTEEINFIETLIKPINSNLVKTEMYDNFEQFMNKPE